MKDQSTKVSREKLYESQPGTQYMQSVATAKNLSMAESGLIERQPSAKAPIVKLKSSLSDQPDTTVPVSDTQHTPKQENSTPLQLSSGIRLTKASAL